MMRLPLLLLLAASPGALFADAVTLRDGTYLRGRIGRIAEGKLEIQVMNGVGPLSIPLVNVESFRTDEAVRLSGQGGAVLDGVASAVAGRAGSSGGGETFALNERLELWREPRARPVEIAPPRAWKMQADLDLSGRSGAAQGSGFSAGFQAKGTGAADTLSGSVRLVRATSGNQTSADDLHVNVSYETNPTGVVFWYARTDTGYDNARQVDFLSVNAAGLGLRLFTDALGKLDARVGLAHRYENYALPGQASLSTPSMDLGLLFEREFGWAKLETALSVVPSFQDAGDYYVRHESALNILRGAGPLSLKLGISNDFRGKPIAVQVRLDTAYFLRAVYAWK
ncbi:hypothetical protein EMGBD4_00450 [Verrucomicrobiota bacterium]|nr:hypothetical protein EMGBD4_00450 [Verrucomicrobiota bacterium]